MNSKTLYCWCAANVGLIGMVQALYTIGMTCMFRMEEVRYLEYGPLFIWLVLLFFFVQGKLIQTFWLGCWCCLEVSLSFVMAEIYAMWNSHLKQSRN